MKQKYLKPALYIENFELAEHITSGCFLENRTDFNVTHRNGNNCYIQGLDEEDESWGVAIFTSSVNNLCVLNASDMPITCYNTDFGNLAYFCS